MVVNCSRPAIGTGQLLDPRRECGMGHVAFQAEHVLQRRR
jgi:hypothetical protein